MRYISTFSGIEAATVAWEPLGWEPLAFCEIDEFPSAVLSNRYPDVPNLGDITKVNWEEVTKRYGRPDVVVGGSPCQSFSVAGGRESLDGESALCFEYWRAIRDVRPTWFLWENVPGVLNTRDNAFGQFLGKLEELGYGMAWRVLDAQFFGVAQRRRRVFLVGHLGTGGCAAAVLFESESVRGNTQTSKQKREELARAIGRGSCVGRGDGSLTSWDVQSRRIFSEDGTAPTLNSGDREGGNIQPYVLQKPDVVAFKYSAGAAARTMPTYDDGSRNTLTADYHAPAVCLQTDHLGQNGSNEHVKVSKTLDTQGPLAIAFAQNSRDEVRLQVGDGQVTGTIASNVGSKGQGIPFVMTNYGVEDEQSPTLTADYHQPAIAIRTANKSSDGCGIQEGCFNAIACGQPEGVAFVMASGQSHAAIGDGMSPTLTAHSGKEAPLLLLRSHDAESIAYTNYGEELAGTLTRRADSSPCVDRGQNVVFCRASSQPDAATTSDGLANTITCLHDQQMVMYEPLAVGDYSANAAVDVNMVGTLHVGGNPSYVTCEDGSRWVVRRLTPTECERLQGFPDGWTDVPYRGKEHSPDTPRYKAIGNSMAVPVMRWIGERIELVDGMIRARLGYN